MVFPPINRVKHNNDASDGKEELGFIVISPTYRCNLNCRGCYSKHRDKGETLGQKTVETLIDDALSMGVSLFLLSGGEPLMTEWLSNVIKSFPDAFFWLFTNGTLVNPVLIKELAGCDNLFLLFSIEGNKEQTDYRRGQGVFSIVTNSMQMANNGGIPFGFSCMVACENYNMAASPQFVEEIASQGCSAGIYLPYRHLNSAKEGLTECSTEEMDAFGKRVSALTVNSNIDLHFVENMEKAFGGCSGGKRFLHIDPKGFISGCPFLGATTLNINDSNLRGITGMLPECNKGCSDNFLFAS